MHTSTPYLPPELIYSILTFASIQKLTFREPDYKFLLGTALVHSSWTSSAQALIFRHVNHDRGIKFAGFISSATPEARDRLLRHTQILEIGITSKELQTPPNCHEDHFVTILTSCPQIRDLTLRVSGIFEYDSGTTSTLKDWVSSTGSIKNLQVLSYSVESPTIFPILALFPTVTTLTVGTELAISPRETPPPAFQLIELILYRIPHIQALDWLLASSKYSLRTLELRDATGANADVVLERYTPNLETLRIMGCTPQSFRLITTCTRLKAIAIFNLAKITPFPPLPPTIERLSFMHTSSVFTYQLKPIIQAIDRLPHLKLIRCENETESHPSFPELQAKCTERGIVIDSSTVKYIWSLIA